MFETLFTRPGVLRRHRDGPLAAERASYLSDLAAQDVARGTILRRSSYCLRVAVELERWPADRCFDEDEVEQLGHRAACQWARVKPAMAQGALPVRGKGVP